ncbi:MAG: hypothetical protein QNI99_04815 [Woeseiaceae bacterium]|nr:hypothetical protein [Woeseiaceae bacterium]
MTASDPKPPVANHLGDNRMSEDLTQVATLKDEASAEALAGMLRSEGVPVNVRPVVLSPLPDLVHEVQILVPDSLAHRARWFINSSKVSDAELRFAATGELGREDEN